MATNNNTIKTRIQLKSDTEENWRKSVLTKDSPDGLKQSGTSFVPLQGELIVYTPDSTHPFSRLKIGDGNTNIVNLPFIDSGTLNGNETIIVKKNTYNDFPIAGSSDKLYVDLSTNKIYHYTASNGYTQLSNFNYNLNVKKDTVGSVFNFFYGVPTIASVENNVFKVTNGVPSDLYWGNKLVVTDVDLTEEVQQ